MNDQYTNYYVYTRHAIGGASYTTIAGLVGLAIIRENGSKRLAGNLHFLPLASHLLAQAQGSHFDPLEEIAKKALRQWGISTNVQWTNEGDLDRFLNVE